YYTGRDNNALKVKSYIDEECEVVGYNDGNGKYEGVMGSLSCRLKNLKVIKIGSGFTDNQREVPPKIGAIITFKYYGLTTKGNPRFPIFLRIRK
ncbi:MAG: DNA ligase, partial [Sulfurimonas sp.]|nr:DNA ligase [Sulfurimonas sp.]